MKSTRSLLSFLLLTASSLAGNLTWNTAGPTNTWSTSATDANWTGDSTTFATNDNVTFSGAAGETITIATGGVSPAAVTVNHTAGNYAFSGASITASSLSKSGAGILTFNQTNNFTSIFVSGGPTTNNTAGTSALVFTVSNALGSTPIAFSNTSAIAAINTNGTNLTVNNPIALTSSAVQTAFVGKDANTQTYNGVISGGNAATGSILFINMDTSSSNGVIKLANTANTFTVNRIAVNRGVLAINANGSLGAAANVLYLDTTSLNGGLRFDADNINITHPVQFNDYTRINVNSRTGAQISSNITGSAGSRTTPYTISGGNLKLSGNNTFYHYLDIASGGTLTVSSTSALGTAVGTADRTRVSSGGCLIFDNLTYGSNETLEISGTGVSNSGAISASGTSTFNGPISLLAASSIHTPTGVTLNLGGAITGAFELTKTGAGSLSLSGSTIHSGNTRVSAGNLSLSGSMTPTGGFVISPGATLDHSALANPLQINVGNSFIAGRTGTPATDVTGPITTNGGTLKILETNGIGSLSLNGTLSLNGGGIAFDLTNNPSGTNDRILTTGALNLNAFTDINLTLTNGALGNGSYVLVQATSITGDLNNLSLFGLPAAGTTRQTYSLSTTSIANALTLDVTGNPATLVWTGASTQLWTTATDENWNNLTAPDPQDRFFNSDSVSFNDLPSPGNATVQIDTEVTPGSITVNNSTGGTTYTFSGFGQITGSASFTKQGTGSLTITEDYHTFSGAIQLNGGVVNIKYLGDGGTFSSLGSNSTLNFDGGALSLTDTLNGSSNRSLTIASGGATLGVANSGTTFTSTGIHSGNGPLKINGLGRVILNGSNTRTGNTTIQSGASLEITGSHTLSTGNVIMDGTLVLNRSSATTLSQTLSGSGSLVKQSTSTLTLSQANTYSGGTSLEGGNLSIGNASALGTGPLSIGTGASTNTTDTAILNTTSITTNLTIANAITLPNDTLASNRGLYMSGTGNTTRTVELSGKISGGSAFTTLYLNNNLSGAFNPQFIFSNPTNDFRANIQINRGGIQIHSDSALGDPANTVYIDSNSGADITFLNPTTYTRNTSLFTATDFDTGSHSVIASGTLLGTAGLTKIGSGSLNLTGNSSSYTGTITLTSGTLLVDGTIGTATATVSTAISTTLGGSGTINRPVIIGGTIAPGNSIGTLTTGALTLNGTYACEISGNTCDILATTNLTLGASSQLTITDNAGTFPRVVATYSGTLTGTFATTSSGYVVDYSTPGQIIVRKGGYSSWASTNASSAPANQDSDHDGVPNGVEYFMGLTGNSFTANPSIDSNGQITWPKDNTVTDATYVVEFSENLQSWNPVTSGVSDLGTSVVYTLPTNAGPHFVRLRVTITP